MELEKWRVLAHRGIWNDSSEQNTLRAITDAWSQGFSVETDIRDFQQSVVVSHDPPGKPETLKLSDLLNDLRNSELSQPSQVIALNVKSDGLLGLLPSFDNADLRHFFFDMSVPEFQKYISAKAKDLAVRLSEFEQSTEIYEKPPSWIWLDGFNSDWWLEDQCEKERINALATKNAVVIVSPELHGRDPSKVWDYFIEGIGLGRNVYICTDFPDKIMGLAKHEV